MLDISLDILSLSLSLVYFLLFFTCILGLIHISFVVNTISYVYLTSTSHSGAIVKVQVMIFFILTIIFFSIT